MKRVTTISVLLLICLVGTGVATGAKVLATFDGGQVTEQELLAYADMKKRITVSAEIVEMEKVLHDPKERALAVDSIALFELLARLGTKYSVTIDEKLQRLIDEDMERQLSELYEQKVILPEARRLIEERERKLAQYMREHKLAEKYLTTETVRLRHIFFNTLNANEQEKEKKKQLATEVLRQIRSGEDFIELAKQYSETKPERRGQIVGSYPLWKFNPAIARALDQMTPGEISELVETDKGYEILKLETKNPPRRLPDSIREELTKKFPPVYVRAVSDKKIEELWQQAEVVMYEDRLSSDPQQSDTVVARSKFFTLTNQDLALAWEKLEGLIASLGDVDDKTREYAGSDALKGLITIKLMVREARRLGLDKEPLLPIKQRLITNSWLGERTFQKAEKGLIPEIKKRNREQIAREVLEMFNYRYQAYDYVPGQ